jgi:hypothetical protein
MSGRSIQSWKRSRGSNAAPAPRLIPAETKNQPRTNIESGTANGGTSPLPFEGGTPATDEAGEQAFRNLISLVIRDAYQKIRSHCR